MTGPYRDGKKENEAMTQIRTVLIGFGYRGRQLLHLMRLTGLFDVVGVAGLDDCAADCGTAYYRGADAFAGMLDELRPELAVVTTPWHLHVAHATACVEHRCHVALEIKGGLCIGEYEPLISLSERMDVKVLPLENTLFMREILAVKRMADEGVLGDIVYLRGGYRHDLRDILLDDRGRLGRRNGTESVWRSRFYTERNADIYPTHALGPLCMILGEGRRDRLAWLTSFATKAAGLRQRMRELGNAAADAERIALGDIVATQIETERGALISLTHDTTLPRPRSLDFKVQGTRGIWNGVNRKIYVEGVSPHEQWEDDAPYVARYESRYWQEWGREALERDRHHGGMDYVMLRAVADSLRGGMGYPASLRDLALWASVTPLSEISLREHRRVPFVAAASADGQ